ncbi:hypothetical protein Gohar_026536 [Gossypium harknessii]|uniref:Uncharacterized protein n=1 Tax=Gossypium harknessii TaxID=34285 RepID=A0A7J9HRY3_9ROSI|nr:hypothetical protein [Gossypium harknessii]
MLEPIMQIRDSNRLFKICLVEKTIVALVRTSIGRWLLLKMLCGTHI